MIISVCTLSVQGVCLQSRCSAWPWLYCTHSKSVLILEDLKDGWQEQPGNCLFCRNCDSCLLFPGDAVSWWCWWCCFLVMLLCLFVVTWLGESHCCALHLCSFHHACAYAAGFFLFAVQPFRLGDRIAVRSMASGESAAVSPGPTGGWYEGACEQVDLRQASCLCGSFLPACHFDHLMHVGKERKKCL